MTSFNNFDQSSTGISISGYAFIDNSRAQDDFDQSFISLRRYNSGETSALYYIDFGNLPGPEAVNWTLNATTEAKAAYLKAEGYDFPSLSAEGVNIDAEILANIRPDLGAWATGIYLDEYPDLGISTDKVLEIVTVRGYSQGDVVQVVYCPADIAAWGKKPTDKELRDDFQHLIYDAPISASVIINGEEYFYELDTYDWQRQEWIDSLTAATGIAATVFDALLPKNLNHEG
jgi:hypothetical protein